MQPKNNWWRNCWEKEIRSKCCFSCNVKQAFLLSYLCHEHNEGLSWRLNVVWHYGIFNLSLILAKNSDLAPCLYAGIQKGEFLFDLQADKNLLGKSPSRTCRSTGMLPLPGISLKIKWSQIFNLCIFEVNTEWLTVWSSHVFFFFFFLVRFSGPLWQAGKGKRRGSPEPITPPPACTSPWPWSFQADVLFSFSLL